jgi:nucleotide-binding universal stress UspA family protein
MTPPRTILVATDFSEHADRALDYAVELATRLGAKLHLVHAAALPLVSVPEMGISYNALTLEELTARGREGLDACIDRYRARLPIEAHIAVGDARTVIDDVAKQIGAELVVMGTHGRRGIGRVLLGSVAESVVRTAPCPVMTIRPLRA